MPEDFDPDAPDADDQFKAMRAAANRTKEAETRAAQLERELAFTKAGIPDSPVAQYFVKGYEGEMTADAIRAEAVRAGLLADDGPQIPPAESQALDQMANASAGAGPPNASDNPAIMADLDAATAEAIRTGNNQLIYDVMVKHNIWAPQGSPPAVGGR